MGHPMVGHPLCWRGAYRRQLALWEGVRFARAPPHVNGLQTVSRFRRQRPDDTLVRVRAAGVGPWDAKTREGLFGMRSFAHVLGVEASGIVESAGENVAAPAQKVARKPASLSFEEAAGVRVAGSAAYQGIVEQIGLKEGETVLIAGGVGTMAVQIAASLGACVLGTSSPANHDYLLSLGAAEAIDHHEDWVAAVKDLRTRWRGRGLRLRRRSCGHDSRLR
jgi:NADPH:quinone reductase-like Zn-dependent oxidoreductase